MGLVQGGALYLSRVISAIKSGFNKEQVIRDSLPSTFHFHRCIFVHIPKSAGTSICKSIFGYQVGHRRYADYAVNFSPKLREYFKFSFVRNPWDRALSSYLYLRNKSDSSTPDDVQWADNNLRKYKDFNEFVKGWLNNGHIMDKVHFVPQYKFISDEKGVIKMDFVGRFENIVNDFNHISSILNLNGAQLPNVNSTEHRHYSLYYDDESIEIIRSLYSVDITTFNYVFEDKRDFNVPSDQ